MLPGTAEGCVGQKLWPRRNSTLRCGMHIPAGGPWTCFPVSPAQRHSRTLTCSYGLPSKFHLLSLIFRTPPAPQVGAHPLFRPVFQQALSSFTRLTAQECAVPSSSPSGQPTVKCFFPSHSVCVRYFLNTSRFSSTFSRPTPTGWHHFSPPHLGATSLRSLVTSFISSPSVQSACCDWADVSKDANPALPFPALQ